MDQQILNFNPDELRNKYKKEKDKRLRIDGNDQYKEVKGDFKYFVEDPYISEINNKAINIETEVAIIGGGFGGILAASRLREAGINDFKIIEKGGDFGGTWYWNRYPGASCDIESYIYLPLLEETKFIPKQKYTNAPETLEYMGIIANQYNLYANALFQKEVVEVFWLDEENRWSIISSNGDNIKARYVVHSNGPLNRPKLPAIDGITNFSGHTFHTSRWDYDYTGGNSEGNLENLKDKKVAVIGTGATAIQCIPHLGISSKHLYVFQRTPSSIDERNNLQTDNEWFKNLKPGWQSKRRDNFEGFLTGNFSNKDLVNDGWTEIFRSILGSIRDIGPSRLMILVFIIKGIFSKDFYKKGLKNYMRDRVVAYIGEDKLNDHIEMADFKKMEKIRARAERMVDEPDTAESLKPYYRQFCKRPCFHDEYLSTYNNDNVTLVDTDGKGIDHISEKGIIFNDRAYEVDCIIFATGFEVGTDYTRRSGYEITGINNLKISEKWSDGLVTLHGMHCNGFPNSFFFGPQQAGFTANFTHCLDEQSVHLAYIIGKVKQNGKTYVEVSKEAESEWVSIIIDKARNMQSFQESCTPGYYNNEGQPSSSLQNNPYGGGSLEFFQLLNKWRRNGSFDGLFVK